MRTAAAEPAQDGAAHGAVILLGGGGKGESVWGMSISGIAGFLRLWRGQEKAACCHCGGMPRWMRIFSAGTATETGAGPFHS